ncbi:MAG: hypothetical protein ACMUHX_09890 [bacterium]
MPTNLNALIRYKTIDQCLRNPHRKHDIKSLMEACSEALAEYRGVYKGVGERTIRDDIRVMRSDILGFNAPIVFNEGYYSYSDPDYSIFSASIQEVKLLSEVFKLLVGEWKNFNKPEILEVLKRLARITRQKLPPEVATAVRSVSMETIEEEDLVFEQRERQRFYTKSYEKPKRAPAKIQRVPGKPRLKRGISFAKMGPTFIDIESQTDFYLKRRGFLGLFRKKVEILLQPYSWESILNLFG